MVFSDSVMCVQNVRINISIIRRIMVKNYSFGWLYSGLTPL